ncbi:YfjI family protein [Caballeronia sp. LZ062]|uniref:YfjI family protein n=1 Tax=unclassified Caballeronia TaxID=2646786 RepID=UPI00285A6697|nr:MULTISPECIES: YfjI family protein [unclassified Caballeronia]MDR5855984.1 YfjI family protein [Caballeronia sp. LZ050]MDR5872230.1 YfjI family protein [Caballeronia sp. LZ062]
MNNGFNQAPPLYPINAFPAEIEDAMYEVMNKVKSPDALVATSFLATMSIVCQGLIDVKLPIGQISPVSLNVLVKAESGERKTATDKIVGAPIYAHDEASVGQYEHDLRQYRSDYSFWKTVESAIKGIIAKAVKEGGSVDDLRMRLDQHLKEEPVKPRSRRFIHQNATEAALMHILEGEGRSIAIASDEGEVVFKGGLMNRAGLRNKGWDGAQLLVFDRVSTGSIIARQPRVTVNIMVQDAVLDVYQQDRGAVARGSGFWARYLVGAPDSTQGFRFITYIDEEWHHLPAFHSRVKELLDRYDSMMKSGEVKRQVIEFDPAAAADWIRMVNVTEGMIQPWQYLSDIHDFASKVMEIVSRVAALLHFFTRQKGRITLDTFNRAKAIVEWHLHEYKRLFSPQAMTPTMLENMVAVEKHLYFNYWKVGLLNVGKNQVLRNGPNHLRSKGQLEPVIHAMTAQGRIGLFKDGPSNRIMIALNPNYFNSLMYQ